MRARAPVSLAYPNCPATRSIRAFAESMLHQNVPTHGRLQQEPTLLGQLFQTLSVRGWFVRAMLKGRPSADRAAGRSHRGCRSPTKARQITPLSRLSADETAPPACTSSCPMAPAPRGAGANGQTGRPRAIRGLGEPVCVHAAAATALAGHLQKSGSMIISGQNTLSGSLACRAWACLRASP